MIEFAKVKKGHDKNHIYYVANQDEEFLYLVNGVTKKTDHPKKKKRIHVQVIKTLPQEVLNILGTDINDMTVQKAIETYMNKKNEMH